MIAVQPRVQYLSSDPGAEWDEYVRAALGATPCHLSGWLNAVERTWHHDAFRLVCAEGDRIRGVLPLMHVRSPLFGSMLVSTPAAIYGGPLADSAAHREALVAEAARLAVELKVDYLELREAAAQAPDASEAEFRCQDLYVTFECALAEDSAKLLASLPKKIRYQLRQAANHGLRAESGGVELLDDFYGVYAANMRRLGTPVYPKRLFVEFLDAFGNSADILITRRGADVAGATLNFYFRDTALPYYGCARAELHHTGVSAFMYWEVMRRAAARGYSRFDFGRSKIGSGSWAFKRGWRMNETPLAYRVLLVRAKRMPNLNPTNPRFRVALRLWKRLPLTVTRIVGPAVVKYIP